MAVFILISYFVNLARNLFDHSSEEFLDSYLVEWKEPRVRNTSEFRFDLSIYYPAQDTALFTSVFSSVK